MARTPIGVLSFESSLPPLAHFLSAENIAERWLTTYYMIVSRLRDLIHVVRRMLNISKMMLEETLQWHSWQRWRIARLLSQNKVFLHRMLGKPCHAMLTPDIMYQSKLKLQHPPPAQPPTPGIWTFDDSLLEIPSPRSKKAVQMPH